MHESISSFLKHLELTSRSNTARGYSHSLKAFEEWMKAHGKAPHAATLDDLQAYQRFLAEEYRCANGERLKRGTQVARLSAIKSYYRWLAQRGVILVDVSRKLKLPNVYRNVTTKDYLSLQEATALLQTQARRTHSKREGSYTWAKECRILTLLCLALATGRRQSGLRNLKVQHLNFQRNEIRCEREKGKSGRVLPVKQWAMAIAQIYVEKARPILDWEPGNEWLFVGEEAEQIGKETMNQALARVYNQTVADNSDLEELAAKHLSFHCFRVSFASLLFGGGCNIRSINELMMHEQLSTTARYTPIPLEDLRRVCRVAHPRA